MTSFGPMFKEFLRDRLAVIGLLIILSLLAIAFFAPYIAPDPDAYWGINPSSRLKAPSMEHPFGTDHMGRDLLSRVIFGTRITFIIALLAVSISLGIGVPIGLLAGYFEKNWNYFFVGYIVDTRIDSSIYFFIYSVPIFVLIFP